MQTVALARPQAGRRTPATDGSTHIILQEGAVNLTPWQWLITALAAIIGAVLVYRAGVLKLFADRMAEMQKAEAEAEKRALERIAAAEKLSMERITAVEDKFTAAQESLFQVRGELLAARSELAVARQENIELKSVNVALMAANDRLTEENVLFQKRQIENEAKIAENNNKIKLLEAQVSTLQRKEIAANLPPKEPPIVIE